MSNDKKIEDLLNLTSTIIGLTSIMYGNEFALTITNREKCLFSKWTEGIDFGFRVGDKVLKEYGAFQCMKTGKSIKLEVSRDEKGDAYIVFSQPIHNESEIVGSLNVITTLGDEELLYNIRSTFNISHYKKTIEQNDFDETKAKLIGESRSTKSLIEKINKVKNIDSTVLITGESGTGKGVVAKMLHYEGSRKFEPFIHVNCASLPTNLIESELFGHVKGAYTGADTMKKGKFEIAGEGTIFLDEINSLDISLQAKLLSVIQEKEVTRIGSNKVIPVTARIITATNENLEEMIRQKRFRKDLYYRLSVIVINCQPLRNRKKDLDLLIVYFIKKIGKRINKPVVGLTKEAREILEKYEWPGNVRELENSLECAIALAGTEIIEMDDLPPRFLDDRKIERVDESRKISEKSKLEMNEIETIRRALIKNNGHRQNTADDLGITRRSLQYKLKKYDMIDFKFLPKNYGLEGAE